MSHKNLPIFIPHLACRNDCVFCNQKKIAGTLSPPTPNEITSLLEEGLAHLVCETQIAFFGGSFTGLEKELMEEYLAAAYPFVRDGGYSGIRLSTRPDYISPDILSLLKKYKVQTIELGVQSLDKDVLIASNRGHTVNDVYTACGLIRENGFELILQMMVGLPLDTKEKSVLTAEKIAEIHPDGVRIYPTVVIKDTMLNLMYQQGTYTPLTVEEAVDICSELVLIFEKNNIPVIRLGLHSDKSLTEKDGIVAGPFHPAFGELCESRIYLDIIKNKLGDKKYENITVCCPKGEISKITGNKRENINKLKAQYNIRNIKVTEDSALAGRDIKII